MTIDRFAAAILPLLAAVLASPPQAQGADGPPEWAYQITPANLKPAPDDGAAKKKKKKSKSHSD